MIAILAGVAAIAAYVWALARYNVRFPERAFSALRIAAFVTGTAIVAIALLPFADAMADRSFAAHMVQHLALTLVGPPLILCGAPLLLLVAVPPPASARRITAFAHGTLGRALFAPVTGWLTFVALLWIAHFSPLYNAALEHPAVHMLEHALFLTAAFLFWGVVVQVGYAPRPVPFPARVLYLFLAIPQGAFLGFAIYAARGVLYPHYAHLQSAVTALADQQNGGAVMWIGGGFLMFAAFMLTAGAWAMSERAVNTAAEPRVATRY
jgi:cytochrome c oxidase assembly factor CtaG